MKIVSVPAEQTHALRRSVLRSGNADADVRWAGDRADGTLHLAALGGDDSTVVGVSTWITVDSRTQLRGMATDPLMTGQGIGKALLDAGIAHARAVGSSSVWANARVTAIDFYRSYGFVVSGPEFVTPATGLAHRLATLDLTT